MRTLLAAAAALAILLPVAAQGGMCVDAEKGHRMLAERYHEQPVARGVADGRLVLLYTSSDGETWTVAAIDPAHNAICIIAAGESWDTVETQAPGRPS
ncbi:MAG: hypothetical protein RIB84_06340 [Sneathiellaceae bacterium]